MTVVPSALLHVLSKVCLGLSTDYLRSLPHPFEICVDSHSLPLTKTVAAVLCLVISGCITEKYCNLVKQKLEN